MAELPPIPATARIRVRIVSAKPLEPDNIVRIELHDLNAGEGACHTLRFTPNGKKPMDWSASFDLKMELHPPEVDDD